MYGKPPPSEWGERKETRAAYFAGWRAQIMAHERRPNDLRDMTIEDTTLDRAFYDGYIAAQEAIIDKMEKERAAE